MRLLGFERASTKLDRLDHERTLRSELRADLRVLSNRNNAIIGTAREINQMGSRFAVEGSAPRTSNQFVRLNPKYTHLTPRGTDKASLALVPVAKVQFNAVPSRENPEGYKVFASFCIGDVREDEIAGWIRGTSSVEPILGIRPEMTYHSLQYPGGVAEEIIMFSSGVYDVSQLASYRDEIEARVGWVEELAAVTAEAAMDPTLNPHLHN